MSLNCFLVCVSVYCQEVTHIPVRVKRTGVASGTFEDIQLPMLDPHRLVDHLFHNVGLDIPQNIVNRFWHMKRNVAKEKWALDSPASKNHIPIAVYGDACQCRGGVKLLGIFLSFPLWRAKSTRCSRWLICGLEEGKLWGTQTLNAIMKRIAFSLNLLFDGWDSERGVSLAGGRVFTLTELRGDWLWHKQLWNFSSSWKSLKNICYRCNCVGRSDNRKDLYWEIDRGEWHEYSRGEFIACQLQNNQHPSTRACNIYFNLYEFPLNSGGALKRIINFRLVEFGSISKAH